VLVIKHGCVMSNMRGFVSLARIGQLRLATVCEWGRWPLNHEEDEGALSIEWV
jgi:hypothetical protein